MSSTNVSTTSIGEWLTIERLIYGVILIVGGFIRFFALDAQPLNMGEAAASLVSWTAAMGFESRSGISMVAEALPPTSPLLYALQGLLFWVVGGSDFAARMWPAVAGIGLVLLPWFARREIGRYPAIVLALLFAIDPWLNTYSRLADGTSLSALLGMIVLFGLSILHRSTLPNTKAGGTVQPKPEPEPELVEGVGGLRQAQPAAVEQLRSDRMVGWRNAVWLSAGLLLISGPQAWSFALVIALFLSLNGIPKKLLSDVRFGENSAMLASTVQPDLPNNAGSTDQPSEADTAENDASTDDSQPVSNPPQPDQPQPDQPQPELVEGVGGLRQAQPPATDSPATLALSDVEGLALSDVEGSHQPPTTNLGIWLFVGALLLGSTGWLAFPEGLSYIGTSATRWVEQIVGTSNLESPVYSLTWLVLRLLVDQSILIVLGTIGLIALWKTQPDPDLIHSPTSSEMLKSETPLLKPQFLTLWLLLGLILVMLPGRGPFSLLMLELPLLLSTAKLLGGLAEKFIDEVQFGDAGFGNSGFGNTALGDTKLVHQNLVPWQEIRFVILALSALLILAGFVTASLIESSQLSTTLLLTALLVMGIIILTVVILALMIGWEPALRVAGLYIGVLLCLVNISNSWHLNHRLDPLAPDAFFEKTTSTDVRTLVEDIRTLSAQRIGDPEEIDIRAELGPYPDPVLAWNLRNMRNLTWTPSPSTAADGSESQIVLLTFGESVTSQAASESYLGSDYTLRQNWLPSQLPAYKPPEANTEEADAPDRSALESLELRWSAQLQPLLRWMIYRKISQTPPTEKVVLWTRGF